MRRGNRATRRRRGPVTGAVELAAATVVAVAAVVLVAACSSSSSTSSAPPLTGTPGATGTAPPGSVPVGPQPSGPPCSPARPAAASAGAQTFRYQDQDRSYLLALPAGYDGTTAWPMVLNFHGFLGSKDDQETNTAMAAKGTARGFVVVTPESLGTPRQWNMFGQPDQADDFGFVHALVADLSSRLCIDANRVYAAGHSNGAAFVGFLACKPPFDFAAIAMVSATTPSPCPDGVTPSVIAVAGTADPQVPYTGGTIRGGSGVAIPAAKDVAQNDAQRFHCAPTPKESTPQDGVEQLRYGGCAGGGEVVLDTVVGGVHEWPGGPAAAASATDSAAGKAFDATAAILDFFAHHTRSWGV